MDESPRPRIRTYFFLSLAVVVCTGSAFAYRSWRVRHDHAMSVNFQLTFPRADPGWQALPHGPYSIFVYEQKATKLQMRGAVNNLISDINPTPDMDRDNIANLMVDNTHDNMPGWTAVALDGVVEAHNTSFRLVRRAERGHVVVTAFAVKGNTTVLISLSGRDGHSADVDKAMGEFDQFLSRMTLTQANLDL
jgi:hypothetical protein